MQNLCPLCPEVCLPIVTSPLRHSTGFLFLSWYLRENKLVFHPCFYFHFFPCIPKPSNFVPCHNFKSFHLHRPKVNDDERYFIATTKDKWENPRHAVRPFYFPNRKTSWVQSKPLSGDSCQEFNPGQAIVMCPKKVTGSSLQKQARCLAYSAEAEAMATWSGPGWEKAEQSWAETILAVCCFPYWEIRLWCRVSWCK